jgi:alpha-L-fucosidase 2
MLEKERWLSMKIPALLLSALILLPCGLQAGKRTDIEYGTAGGESLRLDANVPEGKGPFPAVILVHGGAWSAGDKSGGKNRGLIAPMEDPLSRAGFAWFSINYRLAPTNRYPACIEDVETAIRWVKAHAGEFSIDTNRIALAGESAGAHLAALAAVRARPATRVQAVVAFYGGFDLNEGLAPEAPLWPSLAALTGFTNYSAEAASVIRAASPITYVKPGLPPFLLLHGTDDTRVAYAESLNFQARLKAVGVPCDLITIYKGAHGMGRWEPLHPGFKTEVAEWLRGTLTAK